MFHSKRFCFEFNCDFQGVSTALLSGMALTMWINFGGPRPPIVKLPVSVDSCEGNFTLPTPSDPSGYFYLYRISYLWTSPVSWTLFWCFYCWNKIILTLMNICNEFLIVKMKQNLVGIPNHCPISFFFNHEDAVLIRLYLMYVYKKLIQYLSLFILLSR